jgi:hypothetical protein
MLRAFKLGLELAGPSHGPGGACAVTGHWRRRHSVPVAPSLLSSSPGRSESGSLALSLRPPAPWIRACTCQWRRGMCPVSLAGPCAHSQWQPEPRSLSDPRRQARCSKSCGQGRRALLERHSQPLRLCTSDRATEPTSAHRSPSFTTLTWLRILPVRGARLATTRADAPASEARIFKLAPGGRPGSTLQNADEAIRLSNISFRPHEAVHPSSFLVAASLLGSSGAVAPLVL